MVTAALDLSLKGRNSEDTGPGIVGPRNGLLLVSVLRFLSQNICLGPFKQAPIVWQLNF